jgi:hypothetical protein
MSFEEFNNLFQNALNIAIKNAEEKLNLKLPSKIKIVLHGAGYSGDIFDPDIVAKHLYIGENKFYRIIDLSVIRVNKTECIIFVRVSSHTPSEFNATWNTPLGSGPFKQILSDEIIVD